MNRRFTLAIAATTAVAIAAGGIASAGAVAKAPKPKKNEIVIKGNFVFKAGRFAHDNQRFKPLDAPVKSGATVTVRNRSKAPDPHTLSFVEKKFLPKSFDAPIAGPLFGLHNLAEEENAEPVFNIDNGAPAADQSAPLSVDTLGTLEAAGDSLFIAPGQKKASFKVTAPKGSALHYFCIFHPWMQGKISVK